jgi:hypothetical protein
MARGVPDGLDHHHEMGRFMAPADKQIFGLDRVDHELVSSAWPAKACSAL